MSVTLSVLISANMEKMDYISSCLFESKLRALVYSWHDCVRTASFILT